MDPNIHLKRLQHWAGLVLEAENSGNKSIWCRENGIRYRKYIYWQKLVREYVLEHGEDSLIGKDAVLPARTTDSHQLVDVTQLQAVPYETAAPTKRTGLAGQPEPELMLEYKDFRIYIGSAVTENTLAAVLKAVRNA